MKAGAIQAATDQFGLGGSVTFGGPVTTGMVFAVVTLAARFQRRFNGVFRFRDVHRRNRLQTLPFANALVKSRPNRSRSCALKGSVTSSLVQGSGSRVS
jgi:hypothetical protein